MTLSQTSSLGLPYSPAVLASNGEVILVADRSGSLLFWQWPESPGSAIKAHEDSPKAVAIGRDFATTGGWDLTVKRWDAIAQKPRFSVKPFKGRITAICAQGDDLVVAGANRDTTNKSSEKEDRVFLQPGELRRVDATGKLTPIPLESAGQIDELACGDGWILAIDRGAKDSLRWIEGSEQSTIPLAKGPATALASLRTEALVADGAGIWAINPKDGTRKSVATFEPDSPQVLALLAINDSIVGATSEGVFRWPGATRLSPKKMQPVALAKHGNSLLVLWEDGWLEELDPENGTVLHGAKVPR
ncbi:hypothetical protein [Limnofasciculus baicalensis]|nr:hypothetical protein [Limnofasciculus baicalensis]